MRVLYGILASLLLLAGVAPALAQGYPNRPVRVVVGFPAGGPTDIIARIVAQRLSDSLASSSMSRTSAARAAIPRPARSRAPLPMATPSWRSVPAFGEPQPLRQGAV